MRRITAILASIVLVSGVLIAAPTAVPAAQAAPVAPTAQIAQAAPRVLAARASVRTRVSTLSLTPKRPGRGESFTISGRLSTAVARRVVLEVRTGKKWRTIAKATTSSTGRFALRTSTKKPRIVVRVRAGKVRIAGRTYQAATSRSKTIRTGLVRPGQPIRGERFRVSSKLKRSGARPVILQIRLGTRWKTLSRGKTRKSGYYLLWGSTTRSRATVRVVAPRAKVGKRRYSREVSTPMSFTTTGQTAALALPAVGYLGRSVTAKLRFTPIRAGRPVALQVKSGSQWKTVGSARQRADGTASIPVVVKELGTTVFRGLALSSSGAPARASASVSMTVKPNVSAPSPAIATNQLADALVGEDYSEMLSASYGTQPFVWSATGLPAGLHLDSHTGEIGGVPTAAGSASVQITVTDANAKTDTKTLALVVRATLSLSVSSVTEATAGETYSAAVEATGGVTPYSWSAWGLPAGMSIDSGTGEITGTPPNGGVFPVLVTVTDAEGSEVTKTVDLHVDAGSVSATPPQMGEVSLPDQIEGSSYSVTPTVSGGTAPFSWTANGLPDGVNIDSATGKLSGTATKAGDFTVHVMVTDSAGLASTRSFSVRIYPAAQPLPEPQIATEALPSAVVGDSYSRQLAVTSGRAPFTWTASGLPAGLSLDSDTITGTPTTAGSASVELTVTDKNSKSDTVTLPLLVGPAVSITTASLDAGMVGEEYAQTLTAAGGTAPYTWQAADLPAGLSVAGNKITGTPTAAGTASVTLTVTDSHDKTSTATMDLLVRPALSISAEVPTGTAGESFTTPIPASGGDAPYHWSAWGLPGGLAIDPDTGVISGTPHNAGVFPVFVTVTDAQGRSVTTQIELTIDAGSVIAFPPVIATASLVDANLGDAYQATLSATMGTEPYVWSGHGLPDGLSLNAATGELSGTPTKVGDYSVYVSVTDANSLTATTSFPLRVYPAAEQPAAPQITTQELPDGVVNDSYSATLAANTGREPYLWHATGLPVGLTLNAATGVISGTPTAVGTASVHLTVTDKNDKSDTATLSLVIGPAVSMTTSTLPAGVVGDSYSVELAASGGTKPYTWAASGLPDGLVVDGGTITGTPTTAGTASVQLTVTDARTNTATVTVELTIRAAVAITTTSLPTAVVGEDYTATLAGTGGTTPYVWSATGLPDGISVSGQELVGTPTTAGTASVTLTVTDDHVKTSTVTLPLVVRPVVSISTTAIPDGIVGHTFSAQLEAAGGTLPYSWTATGLPSGLTLDADSGAIAGTPTEDGSFTVHATVTDGKGRTASADYPVEVGNATTITSTVLIDGMVGYDYDLTVAVAGGLAPYQWVAEGLPSGLAIDATSGAITGVPTQAGTSDVTLTATDDSGQSDTQTFPLVIKAGVGIATTSLGRGEVGSVYSATLAATGGVPGYAWTATGLPTGLTLSSHGTIAGTPSAAGTANVEITVADANGKTATTTLQLVVGAAVAVTTTSLPDGIVGAPYETTLTADGGTAPYSWAVTDAPDGLTVNSETGVLSGTPETVGPAVVTVEVTDANHRTGTVQLLLIVTPAVSLLTTSLPDAVSGTDYAVAVSATGGLTPYSWQATGLPTGLSIDPESGAITGNTTQVGTVTVSITVSDEVAGSDTAEFTLTVGPAISISTTNLPNAVKGTSYAATLVASGGTEPYTWSVNGLPSGLSYVASTGVISGTATVAGTYALTVTATDDNDKGSMTFLELTVDPSVTVATTSLPVAVVGTDYSVTLSGSGGTPPYTWSASGLPSGLTLDTATGEVSGSPTSTGTSNVTVTITDKNAKTASKTLSLTRNPAVSISTTSLTAAVVGTPYSFTMVAAGGSTPYSWSATNLPAGLEIDAETGVISGTPTAVEAPSVTITVTDSGGKAVPKSLSLSVTAAIAITTTSLPGGTTGVSYSFTMVATGGRTPRTWSAVGLPAGLSMASSTGKISGVPTAGGVATVDITATDYDGAQATVSLTMAIAVPLVVDTSSLPIGLIDTAYTTTLSASGGTAPYTWSVTTPPAGLSIDQNTGVLAGTPTASVNTNVKFTVTDSVGTSTVKYLRLTINNPLAWAASSPLTVVQGVAFSHTLEVTGGLPPFTWSATDVPSGLSLDSETGELSGTLSTGGTTSEMQVTVTDSTGYSVSAPLAVFAGVPSAVSAGVDHSCAIVSGRVVCWGSNTVGQLGTGTTGGSSLVPVAVQGLTGVTAIAAGNGHTCAVMSDGVKCWGVGYSGELGNSTFASSNVPVSVTGLTTGVTAISAGGDHTCAVVSGAAKCWGGNTEGELGIGSLTTTSVNSPIQVTGLTSGVTSISAGTHLTCAVVSGAAKCWGQNSYGGVGDGTTTDRSSPQAVSGLSSGVTEITAGMYFACAVVSGGAKCWGYGGWGSLGRSSTYDSATPVSVTDLSEGVASISTGLGTACAVLSSGALQCWGANSYGQVGIGNQIVSVSSPASVIGMSSGVSMVSSGGNNTCALVNDRVKCWGRGDPPGFVGDGAAVTRTSPVDLKW